MFSTNMEREHKMRITETRTDDVVAEQSDISSDHRSYGNKCGFVRKYLPFASDAVCGQQERCLLHGEVRDGNFEYNREPRCLSSYYSVFVARLAIMGMLAILIGLLTILTWHFTTVYTTKSIKSLAYGLRFELLQRPVSRMWNILNATVEINMAQVKLAEYVAGRFPPPLSPDQQVQLYEVMKDITWALFASRKALDAVAVNYNNGHVQAFLRNRRNNSTCYIFSEPANATSSSASRKGDYKEGMSNAPVPSWSNVTRVDSNSSIWYIEPLNPVTGEKNGPRKEIPPDDLINISGISQLHDGDGSWNITVSKFTDSPLLSSASLVRHPIEGHIVAMVGVRTALSSVGQLMKELVDLHSGYMYLTSQEGYLLATSTNDSLLRNTRYGPKLMMAVESSDPIIRAGAKWLQNKYGNGLSFSQEVHVENVMLQQQRFYIDSFFLNLKRLPLVGVIIIPRSYVMGKVDQRGRATLVILISASICILVIGCICILILTSGVSKEMKLRAELISHLDARRRAEASSSYKSQFLANISHELRTPMAAIIGLLDILLCDEYLTTEQIGMVSQIRHCSTALLRLLNNILDLSKVESGKLVLEEADFDLGHELEGLVDMFSVQCVDHDIEIVLDLADDMPRLVRGDSARVLQIFANLISNSIKFTSSGHIILRSWCESAMVNQKSDLVSENDKDYWSSRKLSFGHSNRATPLSQEKITLWFEVEDSGCGIDPSKWESVFESFVQADLSTTRMYGGTGLGLYIVRSLVNKMGGHIKVIQKEGPGTLMRFYLQFGRPVENSKQFFEQLWKTLGKDQPMVLLALKGNMVRLIMSQWLKANGIQAYQASDWNEMMATLSKVIECDHLQRIESTENVLSENRVNHWLPMNACGNEAFTKKLFNLNEERIFRIASENHLSKPLKLFVIVDSRLLDFGMNTWKDQLSHLNEHFEGVKFAWQLNHDISTNVKLELRRMGHSVMVNRPLYKSKLIQTLITMIGDTKIELDKLTGSLHRNFQLNMQEGLTNESTGDQTREEPSDSKMFTNINNTLVSEIGPEFTENTGMSLCHTTQNIPDSVSYSRSLSSSFTTMKERIDFFPYPMKDLNSLIRSSEILTKSEDKTLQNERSSSSKKFKFDCIVNETDTNACYKNLNTSAYPEFQSGNCYEDSFEHMDQSEILTINSISKQPNGRLINVQLDLEEKKGCLGQNLPSDISGGSSCLQMSSGVGFTVAGHDNLKSKDQLSSPSSQSHENGRSYCRKRPMMSEGSSDLPIQMTASNGIHNEKSLEGIRILLAEDTPILQRVAATMLEKLGATVIVVGDGLQAVDALKSACDLGNCDKWTSMDEQINIRNQVELPGSPPFDLVLMDCQMPRMDGYEATKIIRTAEEGTSYHIPIVALTAHAMSSDAAKCLEVGMDAYLTKPIDYKHMVSTILSLTKKKL